MFVNLNVIAVSNPFFQAYISSDYLGKLIILSLVIISILCWTLLIQKIFITQKIRRLSREFKSKFKSHKSQTLTIDHAQGWPNPFQELYKNLKKHTMDILKKNQGPFLSSTDIEFVDSHLQSTIAAQIQKLEKNLFILATIVSLAPFLGLLGTVWGILVTFSELQTNMGGSTQQMVLGGISLALATTVLGLLDAIPALIGYNYLKNVINDYQTEMEGFSTELLASVELEYRKVDVSHE